MNLSRIDYQKRVFKAMDFISANMERNLLLDEIASAACFSPFHFHRIFKAVAGETVADFTRRLRLESVANRLRSHPLSSITEIALDCGFSSSQNMAKAFRNHFGISPTEYRSGGKTNQGTTRTVELLPIKRVSIQLIPDQTVASIRKIGSYDSKTCLAAFSELTQWAVPGNHTGPILAVYWDNPDITPPGKCRFDACLKVPGPVAAEEPVGIRNLEGGIMGICRFETEGEKITQAWEAAFSWMCREGLESRDAPCIEIYRNNAANHPRGQWILDICLPLAGTE